MCWKTIMFTVCPDCNSKKQRKMTQESCEEAGNMSRYGQCQMRVQMRDAQQPGLCGECKKKREKGKKKAVHFD
ncbi:hypothetical protein NW754_014253 [Fusarium falciforme]|uniref:Uncharacterized protein n=1 Tax=Fusarium falciforme TaxID=195108 RepID=A0A9W8V383_9HYPO|nr:hypothetical protein NW754_014253 [Fusarium falciforme]KAJ4191950.1 hypothetical protein NW755_004085 [Fusarium falciforme]KAJ4204251.1 hypothetical protein NW767_004443 [Fusarium falciforme]KAJ4243440.1 hypothetical protein NW757_011303 [Fusarium falciforme]